MANSRKQRGLSWRSLALAACTTGCVPTGGRSEATPAAQRVVPSASATPAPLAYRPSSARRLESIQKSPLALDPSELALLEQNGFVLSAHAPSRTFADAYAQIYRADLPVYVSADSILEAVHRSYDALLTDLERTALNGEACRLLDSMREHLGDGAVAGFGPTATADVDEYLAVGAALCTGYPPNLLFKGDIRHVRRIVDAANAAAGPARESLFGTARTIDYSFFRPRGHYQNTRQLQQYFRTMIWFGSVELHLAEGDDAASRKLDRRSLDLALALRTLLDAPALQRWTAIDRLLQRFLGTRDSLAITELDALIRALGVTDAAAARAKSDAEWLGALAQVRGTGRVAGEIQKPSDVPALPPSSFALFGQRTTPDSVVFSELTYARLNVTGKPPRLMPSSLDIGYAVFGNTAAKALLGADLQLYGAAPQLEQVKASIATLLDDPQSESLYAQWLIALRTLSPTSHDLSKLPKVATSEAWATRVLSTQLASWAELRHNTILYAKQSVSSGYSCSYPDAYVDPYPEFYAALQRYAELGESVAEFARLGFAGAVATRSRDYFAHLKSVAGTLREMALAELAGRPFTAAEMQFINEAVVVDTSGVGCGGGVPHLLGWYARLFYDSDESLVFKPTIADVHTQPTDAAGTVVGHVLHVGTGAPRTMVVTVDTCDGPSAYVGPAFAYYEYVSDSFKRLTDSEWANMVDRARPPAWLSPIMPVVR